MPAPQIVVVRDSRKYADTKAKMILKQTAKAYAGHAYRFAQPLLQLFDDLLSLVSLDMPSQSVFQQTV